MATNSTSGQPIPTQPVLTMQGALLALQNYWADRGCLLVQPFNTEVGAGTYNPATVLRVLGPEPWQVAYVEPSVRPDDARYGENPNRLQTHTQFQVILKPDPGNPQEVYLGSLEALGIDIRAHDIRFVEDNWASPALGAWGLGWEVWLDGLEITQFTYFQQAGGMSLDPVSVEITYGIERIIMALQGVDHFKDIQYSPGITYGEAFGQAEYEMSRYYLDDADIATNQRLFDEYAAEARRCLDAGLPVPAHTYVLKCSHAFNVLDSRGAISTTERARAFARMRGLAREVAQLWSQRREELGHPLGVVTPPPLAKPALPASVVSSAGPATLLFEIGTEELPAAEVSRTAVAVRDALAKGLAGTRLGHGDVRTYSTPRRIVAVVGAVEPSEPDAVKTVRGPKAAAAFTADGEPTPAAAGFARGQKVDVADLQRIDVDGVEYVGIERTEHGRSAVQVLSAVLSDVVGGLRSERNMRWREPGMSFSRPIRWLVALLGDVVVPVTAGSMTSGRVTRVHRTAPEPTVEIPVADGYVERLAEHGIVADAEERRSRIVSGAQKLAASVGGTVNVDRDATDSEAGLLDEITNLVEEPTPILGGFEPRYLDLPGPILTTVMRKHQRYLPVRDTWGNLLPHFVAVANGACDHDVVRAGNEAVLRARYEDAAFFWRADLAIAPAQHKQALTKLTYAEGLGSMAERAERIAAIATDLAGSIALSEEERSTLARAAELTKFDLASHMVIELSSLAGVMAREYARQAGEPAEVAEALFEMELPRSAGDALPSTMPGALLALADRFELLAGLFATGANPTGSSDPFGLRRAALGAVSTLRAHHGLAPVTLRKGLEAAAAALGRDGVEVSAAALDEAHSFAVRRLEQQLLDAGADHRMVQAVLPLADVPSSVDATMAELTARSGDPQFGRLVAALQRVRRIVPAGTAAAYDPGVLVEPAELALHETVTAVRGQLSSDRSDLSEFVEVAGVLTDPINIFFDAVLVMAEDEALRAARLGLLATVAALAEPVLDWQALGSQ